MSLDRESVARQIANHGTNGVEEAEPDADDYAFADYLIRNAYDVHGFSLFFRRLIGGAIIAVLAAILILTAWSTR